MIDWTTAGRRDEVTVHLVNPHSLDTVIGTLGNVDLGGCTVTEDYHSDTRVSAKVSTIGDDGYVEDAWLRIVHGVPGADYSEELFTGPVSKQDSAIRSGAVHSDYELDSNLYTISDDLLVWGLTVGAGGSLRDAVAKLLDLCGREHDLSRMQDKRIQSPVTYERGDSALSDLFDLTADSNRIGVDGHGRVVVERYTAPSAMEPVLDIDPGDPRSIVIGDVSVSDDRFTTPGRVIYRAGSGDDEVMGSADATPDMRSSSARRGYMVARMETAGDLESPTRSQVDALARRSLMASQDIGREYQLTIIWHPLHAGDVVRYRHDGTWRKCLVRSCESDLGTMTKRLTLKEV